MSTEFFRSLNMSSYMAHASRLACLVLLSTTAVAHAARPYPNVIKNAEANGVTVVRTFPAASGLTGWVLHRDGTYSMAFTTADGKTLITGNLISGKGENLTERYAEKYFPKPERAAWYKQLAQSTYVAEGAVNDPKSVLYVFVKPNCPHCRLLAKALRHYHPVGLQVRWIPVALSGSASMAAAIDMLGATDRLQALRQMLEDTTSNSRAAPPIPKSTQHSLAAKIQGNNALLEKLGAPNAPLIVWRDRAHKVQTASGMPRLSELPKILNLPAQDVDDPELAEFR